MIAGRLGRTGFIRTVMLGFSAVALAGLTQSATAQMGGMGGFREMMTPDFNRRDVGLIADGLRLDETQKFILETIYETYEQDFREQADEFRDQMSALREEAMPSEEREAMMQEARERFRSVRDEIGTMREKLEAEHGEDLPEAVEEKFREQVRERFRAVRDEMREQGRAFFRDQTAQDMFGKMVPITDDWNRAKAQLRDEFVADLHMQLTEEQAPLWPGVERLIRRTKSLQDGRLSGESADLFQIVRSLNLDADQKATIQPILDQYEVELDAALQARDKYLSQSWSELLEAMRTMDTADGIAVIEKQTKLRTTVRDVNDRSATNIEQALESAAAKQFRNEFRVRAYPRVFEPTRMERVLTAAENLEDLEPSVAEAVAEMKASYMLKVTAKNESLFTTVRKHEPEQAVAMARRMAARISGEALGEQPEPIDDAMDERREIGERYQTQLTQLLTEEQVALLPLGRNDRRGRVADDDRRGNWRGRRDWRRGGDDGDDDDDDGNWRNRRGGRD